MVLMKIPGRATISNRISTMTSQFARARAPYVVPSAKDFEDRFKLLGIDPRKPECVYCGGLPSEWDHLMPMVSMAAWTGYYTEIANLVPACGKCNQSRGSRPADIWMRSMARLSPRVVFQARDGMSETAALDEVDRRTGLLANAIAQQPPNRMPLLIDPLEVELETCRVELNSLLRRAEQIAARLRIRYQEASR